MLRNKLWRQLVPRKQRHGMLCFSCVSNRLGRPLQPGDFRRDDDAIAEADAEERTMGLEDCGIIDELTPAALKAAVQVANLPGIARNASGPVASTLLEAMLLAIPGALIGTSLAWLRLRVDGNFVPLRLQA